MEIIPGVCPICGTPFEVSRKKGRPREFCSLECQRTYYHLQQVEKWLCKIQNMKKENAVQIRRRFFYLSNLVNHFDLHPPKKEPR